ncbi:peptide ABC transporter ATP-binding protein [Hoeflea olei]|uniref:Peptide ABC transporter ATP-binding protein n=2 Tax=Hoeflea olei TaxID=1480615 RepID=A0A1C1YRM7_9HYPH|nr:peptide ABC transporter ATP-binding protein [Hoeflea olei]
MAAPPADAAPEPTLRVDGLKVGFGGSQTRLIAVEDISLHISPGRTLALVGESGSGKSVTSLAVIRLLAARGRIVSGRIALRDKAGAVRDLVELDEPALEAVRGNDLGMIFQEPMTSLNPVLTVGEQIAEPIRIHMGLSRRAAMQRAIEMLDRVGIPGAAERARQYPHEFSGGMRQRVTIAIALACDPVLLLADEPTTALDVTVQMQILNLLRSLQQQQGMAMLFVTHNFGVVAEIAHDVSVMYAGQIVEHGTVRQVLKTPRHPYTRGLLACVPQLGTASEHKKQATPLFSIPGMVPSLRDMPRGCRFAARCVHAEARCREATPALETTDTGNIARCIRWNEI